MNRPRRSLVVMIAALAAVASGCGSPPQSVPPPPQTFDAQVRAFVDGIYPHGVPYDKARALGPAAEPILIPLINDQAQVRNRSNILVTLGILGSPNAVAEIKKAIEAGTGELPLEEVNVRLDATLALGYSAYAGQAGLEPLEYSLKGFETQEWVARVKWTLPGGGDPAPRLRGRSIIAAGLSGKPEALLALTNLQNTLMGGPGGGRGGPPTTPEQALVGEAIKANQYIAANGMSQYYQTFLR